MSKEHPIPQGLNGYGYLKRASCESCRKITQSFENEVLRYMIWSARKHLGLGGKNKDQPKDIGVRTRSLSGEIGRVAVPHYDIPAKAMLPVFEYAPKLYGGQWPEDRMLEVRVYLDQEALTRAEAAGMHGMSVEYRGPSFLRMLAKIAHAQAVAQLGLNGFHHFLPDFIRGVTSSDEWQTFIGGPPEPRPPADNTVACVNVHRNDWGFLLGRIRLLGIYGAPVYDVAIGRLREAQP